MIRLLVIAFLLGCIFSLILKLISIVSRHRAQFKKGTNKSGKRLVPFYDSNKEEIVMVPEDQVTNCKWEKIAKLNQEAYVRKN